MAVCSFSVMQGAVELNEAVPQLIVFAPRPEYPYQMRSKHVEGKGIFELFFDYDSGNLREVRVIKSTGAQALDAAALSAFRKWKAKPHAVKAAILMPVAFTMMRPR
jgi:TonB family protein